MSIRIPWDKYETALLVEASLKVISDNSLRTQVVRERSSQLRQLAVSRGYTIDDVFRNENGIRMQMLTVIAIITNNKSGLRNASKLFYEMVDIYNTKPALFGSILEEAKGMISKTNDVRQDFFVWLSKKVSSKKLTDLFLTYFSIEKYGKQINLIDDSLFNTLDKDKIKRLSLSIVDKKNLGEQRTALEYYYQYLVERFPSRTEIKEPSSNSLSKAENPIQKRTNTTIESQNKRSFDFYSINSLDNSKPVYAIVYVVKILDSNSWLDLYVNLVKKIWKWHKVELLDYRGKSFTGRKKEILEVTGISSGCIIQLKL